MKICLWRAVKAGSQQTPRGYVKQNRMVQVLLRASCRQRPHCSPRPSSVALPTHVPSPNGSMAARAACAASGPPHIHSNQALVQYTVHGTRQVTEVHAEQGKELCSIKDE